MQKSHTHKFGLSKYSKSIAGTKKENVGERADKNHEKKVFYNLKKEKEKGALSLPDALNHVGRILPKGPTIYKPLKTFESAGRSGLTTGMCSTNRQQAYKN